MEKSISKPEIEAIKQRNKVLGERIQFYLLNKEFHHNFSDFDRRYGHVYRKSVNELIKINDRLTRGRAIILAKRLPYKTLEDLDRNIEEMMPLSEDATMRAAKDYNPKISEFSTYHHTILETNFKKYMGERMRGLGTIPYNVAQRYGEIMEVERKLIIELGREPTPQEIINDLNNQGKNDVNLRKIRDYHIKWLRIARRPVGDVEYRDDNGNVHEIVTDTHKSPLETAIQNEENQNISALVNNGILNEREKVIIKHRFELEGYKFLTLRGLEKKLGVTRERIRQIETIALEKLRKILREY